LQYPALFRKIKRQAEHAAEKPLKGIRSMDIQSLMAPFSFAEKEPYAKAMEAAASGKPVAGYLCSYAPLELLHAAGYLPVRVFSRIGDTHHADELLQTFSCSYARSVLDRALKKEWPFLDIVLFSHTCDTMQNVADLWRAHRGDAEVLIVSVPTQTDGALAEKYYGAELARVRCLLEEKTGPIAEARIEEALALFQQQRNAMEQLYALRARYPKVLTGARVMQIALAAQLMDREAHLAALHALLSAVESAEEAASDDSADLPKVFVAGSMCSQPAFIDLIEEAGCHIVGDDLCVSHRAFYSADAEDGSTLEVLTRRSLHRDPCPAFHRTGWHPGHAMLARVRAAGADGVIFLLTQFCDPMAFDYVPMMKVLEEAGIPAITLSVEQNQEPSEQLRTRVSAFSEMLQGSA